MRWILDAFDWLAHAIGQLYLAQPLTEVDFRKLKVRHPFMMHVTPLIGINEAGGVQDYIWHVQRGDTYTTSAKIFGVPLLSGHT